MKTTVHTCDICKQSKSEGDLSSISVTTRGITMLANHHHPPVQIDICKGCLEKKGFIIERPAEMDESEIGKRNVKTLEDKLFDILEDLGVSFHE